MEWEVVPPWPEHSLGNIPSLRALGLVATFCIASVASAFALALSFAFAFRFRHTFASAVILSVLSFYATQIVGQFTRESAASLGDISFGIIIEQLSGRADLWNETITFIGDHLFFGNYSERLILSTGQYPHSSYMSLLATHGLFLALTLAAFIVSRVAGKPAVLIFLAPILVDAIFQENLFWYISLFDQFLLYMLLVRQPSAYWFNPFPKRTDRHSENAPQMAPA